MTDPATASIGSSNGTPDSDKPLLEVRNLKIYYPIHRGVMLRKVGDVKAVDDISFSLRKGETVGLVGESGCGKTTVGKGIMRLVDITSGQILLLEMSTLSTRTIRRPGSSMKTSVSLRLVLPRKRRDSS